MFKKLFYFNPTERRGVLILLTLILITQLIPVVYRQLKPASTANYEQFFSSLPNDNATQDKAYASGTATLSPTGTSAELFAFDPNTASLEDFLALGLGDKTAKSICNYRDKGGKFKKAEDFKKIYTLKAKDYERLAPYILIASAATADGSKPTSNTPSPAPENFNFDPNTATAEEFIRLGLGEKTAQSILNYRAKGGRFTTREDLGKIYTLKAEDFGRLLPYIVITPPVNAPAGRPVQNNTSTAYAKPAYLPLDLNINAAAEDDFKRLPGIGQTYAARIIKFRNALGGFVTTEQVAETMGLPDSTFQRIKPYLHLGALNLTKLNINTATLEDFDKHPYISKYQATSIIKYREKRGSFKSIDELQLVEALNDDKNTFKRVKAYLTL